MKGKTHIAGGIALGYLAFNSIDILNVNLNDEKVFLLATVGLTLGALLPDIDHSNSIITNRVKPIGKVISKIFKHRGFTHSILGSLVMVFLMNLLFKVFGLNKEISLFLLKSIYIGIMSHIFLDMLTPSGVSLLYPYNKRYNIANFRMGGISESILVILFIGIAYYSSHQII